ncbi:MAG: hypothetical protein ACRENX_09440 [Candidatus Dormibacteria bacterium]
MWGRAIVGVVLSLVGIVFIGQGSNLIHGSEMSGQGLWLGIGCVLLVIGIILIGWTWRSRRTGATSGQ